MAKRKPITTNQRDEEAGYRDAQTGYYDKWYRYNRSDDGSSYDKGVGRAMSEGKCPEVVILIEVNS